MDPLAMKDVTSKWDWRQVMEFAWNGAWPWPVSRRTGVGLTVSWTVRSALTCPSIPAAEQRAPGPSRPLRLGPMIRQTRATMDLA